MEGNGYKTRQSSLLYVFVRFFGLDRTQTTIAVYSILRNKPIETCWLRNSCIVNEPKTKDFARSWTFQHKSCHPCLHFWCLAGFMTIPFVNYDCIKVWLLNKLARFSGQLADCVRLPAKSSSTQRLKFILLGLLTKHLIDFNMPSINNMYWLKEHCHGTLSYNYFGQVQNYQQIEGNLKITV